MTNKLLLISQVKHTYKITFQHKGTLSIRDSRTETDRSQTERFETQTLSWTRWWISALNPISAQRVSANYKSNSAKNFPRTSFDDIYFDITHLLTGAQFRISISSLRSRLQK